MRKPLKIILSIIAGFIILIAGGVAVLIMVFDPNGYKDKLASIVEESTGFKAEFNGPLSLKILPRLAVGAEGVILRGLEDAESAPLLSLKEVRLNMALLPLLSRTIEVDSLHLSGLQVSLHADKQGRGNWKIASGAKGETPAARPESVPDARKSDVSVKAEIGSVLIENCLLNYRNDGTGKNISFSLNQLDLRNIAPGGDMGLSLDAGYSDKASRFDAKLKLAGKAFYDPDKALVRLDLPDLSLTASPPALSKPETLAGKLNAEADLGKRACNLVLNLASSAINVDIQAKGDGSGRSPSADGEFSLKAKPAELLALLGQPPETSDKNVFQALDAAFTFRLSGNMLTISDLKGNMDSTSFQGSASVKMAGAAPKDVDYATQAKLRFSGLDLDRYLPPSGKAAASPDAQGATKTTPKTAAGPLKGTIMEKTAVELDLTMRSLTVKKTKLDNISAKVRADRGMVDLAALTLKVFDGQLKASGKADLLRAAPPVSANASLVSLNVGKLLQGMSITDKLTGLADFTTALSFTGLDLGSIRKTLGGRGNFSVKNGTLRNFQLIPADAPAQILQYRGEDYPFENISGNFSVSNGLIQNKDLKAVSPKISATGSGSVNLAQSVMDYRPVVTIGKTILPLRIHGKFSALSYGPDQEAAAHGLLRGIRSTVEEMDKGAAAGGKNAMSKDKIKQSVREGLKGIFTK